MKINCYVAIVQETQTGRTFKIGTRGQHILEAQEKAIKVVSNTCFKGQPARLEILAIERAGLNDVMYLLLELTPIETDL